MFGVGLVRHGGTSQFRKFLFRLKDNIGGSEKMHFRWGYSLIIS